MRYLHARIVPSARPVLVGRLVIKQEKRCCCIIFSIRNYRADPGLGKTEGLDAGDEERGNRDGDRGKEPVKHKAHGLNPFLRRVRRCRVKRFAAAAWTAARVCRLVRPPIVSDIRGAYVRIRFQNGVRPEKRAAGRESCRFSLVVCYTATGKSHRRCPIA